MDCTPKGVKPQPECSSHYYLAESSPSEFKEEKAKLSSSLKERLKRTRRSFISPLSVAKRLCVDEVEDGGLKVSADSTETITDSGVPTQSTTENRNKVRPKSARISSPSTFIHDLRKEIKNKKETLRRLKLVKMYRSKNDLTQLQTLIDKWRSCAQGALQELQAHIPIDGQKASLSQLMDLFGLDDHMLHFDRGEEDFNTY